MPILGYEDVRQILNAALFASPAGSARPLQVYYGPFRGSAGSYDGGSAWRTADGYLISPQPPAPAGSESAASTKLREAAEAVIWFDWSDNDADAVVAIDTLRAALASTAGDEKEKMGK